MEDLWISHNTVKQEKAQLEKEAQDLASVLTSVVDAKFILVDAKIMLVDAKFIFVDVK